MPRSGVALVTGARRGIGRAIAWALADAGFDIAVNDIVDDEALATTLAGIAERGHIGHAFLHDVGDIDGHAAFVERVGHRFGSIDCLVNNAGIPVDRRGDLLAVTAEGLDGVLRVNLRGTFFLTQAVARRMLENTSVPDDIPRSIVTISSTSARAVSVLRGEYCIAKAGLAMMNQLFAQRLADADIMCYEVRPGIIRTDMTAAAAERYDQLIADGISPVKRWGEPADVGITVAALAQRLLPFNTGDAFNVDGGLHMRTL